MTTLQRSLSGAAAITTAIAPTLGNINTYNASSGPLTVTLPALSGLNVGANCIIKKYQLDGTQNAVTFNASGSDTFNDTTTSVALTAPGDFVMLQVVQIGATKYWQRINTGSYPKLGGITSVAAPVTVSNSTTATSVISTILPAGLLAVGSTFRIRISGTVQTAATSGTLTFTTQLQGTGLGVPAAMASTTSANAASPFALEYRITVQTTGTSGTAIASPWGQINLATTGMVYLTSTVTTAATVNTTAAASSNILQLIATWATASSSNILTVTSGIIERVL